MANRKLTYDIAFRVESSGLDALKKELQNIQNLRTSDMLKLNPQLDNHEAMLQLREIISEAEEVEKALKSAFNQNLGTYNIAKLRQEIDKIGIDKLYTNFSKLGSAGVSTFNNISSSLLFTNTQLKQSNKLLNDMATSFKNTVKWGISSSIWNNLTGSIQKAWNFTKNLDSSLNNIRIVTGKTADEMERFAQQANRVSQELGKSTKDFTDAALIYYQQGLGDLESQARAEITLKVANVTGQSTAEVSEQLTAVWNGYKVSAEEAEIYIDKLAAVAASTASDLEELSTGMSKVASAANLMGVDIDQLTAQLATIVSVTKQAPESVGTALKTIYARMGDIEAGLDNEVSLGKYTSEMATLGINVLNANGQLRNMGEIIEEIGSKWLDYSREQQIALSQTMAGTRQYNNLLSLFDNWGMYTDAIDTSKNSLGTLQEQQDIYMESTKAHLEQLSTATERVMDAFVDNKGINSLIDSLTDIIKLSANFIESLGGGGNALKIFGSIGAQVFSTQIAQSISNVITNLKIAQDNAKLFMKDIEYIQEKSQTKAGRKDPVYQATVEAANELAPLRSLMTEDQLKFGDQLVKEVYEVNLLAQNWEKAKEQAVEYAQQMVQNENFGKDKETGIMSFSYEEWNILIDKIKDAKVSAKNIESIFKAISIKMYDFQRKAGKASEKVVETYQKNFTKLADSLSEEVQKFSSAVGISLDPQKLETFINKASNLSRKTKWIGEHENKTTGATEQLITPNTREKVEEFKILLADLFKDFFDIQEKVTNFIEEEFDVTDTKTDRLKKDIETANENVHKLKKNVQEVSTIDSFIKMTSGIGQFTSAITTAINLIEIWNNENLTAGEKALQTVSALATSIPLLINGIKLLYTNGKVLLAESKKLIASRIKAAAAAYTQAAAEGTLAATLKGVGLAAWEALGPIGLLIAAAGAVATVVYIVSKAYNADANAAKAAAEETKKLKENFDNLQTSVNNLKQTLNEYKDQLSTIESLNKKTIEWKNAIIEANDKAIKLLSTYKDLAKYATRDKETGLIKISQEGMDIILNEQIKKLEQAQLLYSRSAQITSQLQEKADITNFKRNTEGAKKVSDEIIQDIADYMNKNNLSELLVDDLKNIPSVENASEELRNSIYTNIEAYSTLGNSLNNSQKQQDLYADATNQAYLKIKGIINDNDSDNPTETALNNQINSLFNQYGGAAVTDEEAKKRKNQATDSNFLGIKTYEATQDEILDWYKEQYGYSKVSRDIWDLIISNFNGGWDQTDYQVYNRYKKDEKGKEKKDGSISYGDIVKEYYADQEAQERAKRAESTAETNIKSIYDLINQESLDSLNSADNALLKLLSFGGNGKLNAPNSSMSQKQAQSFLNNWDILRENILKTTYSGNQGFESRDTYAKTIEDWLKKRASMNDAEAFGSEYITNTNNTINTVVDQFRQGKLTAEEMTTEYNILLNSLKGIEDVYPELQAEVEILNNSALIGTEAWSESLYKVQQKLNDLRIQDLKNDVQDTENALKQWIEEAEKAEDFDLNATIKINGEDKQFKDLINNLLEANYQIDIEIHAQAEDAFNTYVSASERLEEYASKIGEDYRVAVEDLKALNAVFPNILEGMGKVEDGTAQLSATSVKNAMIAAKENLRASAEETLGKLQNQKTELEAQRVKYKTVLEIAQSAQKGEITSKQAATKIKAALNETEAKNNEELTNTEKENSKLIADDANTNAKIVAENWDEGYSSSAGSAIAFAETAVSAAKAAQTGNIGDIKQYQGKVNYSGKGGQTNAAAKLADINTQIEKASGEGQWDSIIKSAEAAIALVGSEINDINGMIYETGARLLSSTETLNNIQVGKGANKSKNSSDPDNLDYLDDEVDRYHKVNTQIQKVENSLKKLQSQQEKLYGQKLIDNLNQQWEKLNTQINNYNDKLKIAYNEQDELKNKLSTQGIIFNEDGTISNYFEIYNAQEAYVNKLIAQYNHMSKEAQETFKGTIETVKNNLKKLQENMDRYDELVSDFIPGLQQNIQDSVDEQIEIQIQQFNMEIEIRLDLAEAEREWNQFKKRIIDGIKDDDILGNAAARFIDFESYYNAAGDASAQAMSRHLSDTLRELNIMDSGKVSNVYGGNRNQALEDLENYYKEAMSMQEDFLDMQEEIHQAYIDMLDEAQEKFDEQIEMYEIIGDLIEHDMNMITLVYGEEAYGKLSQYYAKQRENNNDQLDFLKQQEAFWKAQMESMEEGSEEWENAKEKMLEAIQATNDKLEESIEQAMDAYINGIEEVFQKLNNEVTGGKGLNYINEQWELINKNAEQYLDTIDAQWGIQQLQNKYMDAYDQTDSISARRKIKEQMEEELKLLQAQDKLTEYDIERANMKYDIMLKQIALQEAQQNKSSMRLRRDSQGNYSYQFIADEDEIGKLQDELGNLYNSLYDFDKEAYNENLNQIYDLWVEFQEKMKEAAQINDPEERAAMELLIREQYEPLLNGLLEENLDIRQNLYESAFQDLEYLYKDNADSFKNMTDEEKAAIMEDLIPQWKSGLQEMANEMIKEGGFINTVGKSLEELENKTQEWIDSVAEYQEKAGQSAEVIAEGIDKNIEKVKGLLEENNKLITTYEQQVQAVKDLNEQLEKKLENYEKEIELLKEMTTKAYEYSQAQKEIAADAARADQASKGNTDGGNGTTTPAPAQPSTPTPQPSSPAPAPSTENTSGGDGVLSKGDTATYTGRYYYSSYGDKPTGSKYANVANGVVVDIITNNPYGIHIKSADGRYRDLGWVKKSQLSGYDTGGYTGEWGNDGRLALLHQKELVLNKEDTENILSAVNLMRGLGNAMLNRLSGVTANNNTGTFDNLLEQQVHIEANFPNVVNSHEIEDAIDNLMNVASQRIGRNRG